MKFNEKSFILVAFEGIRKGRRKIPFSALSFFHLVSESFSSVTVGGDLAFGEYIKSA